MAEIGNLGDIITFEVSSNKVLTFESLQHTLSGRWGTHEVIGGKPKLEYLGPGQQRLTLSIYLTAMHGISPRRVLDAISDATENGETFPLVIGGRKIGGEWIIESASETWGEVIEDGKLMAARTTLTLAEYN